MMIYLKSNAEIEIMRENGKILSEVFEKLKEFIKPGVTTKDVDKLVEDVICSRFAVPSFKGYGNPPFPGAACISVNEEVVHGVPGDKVLQDGDIVGVDIGAFKNGFHIDACRTYPVGQISAEAQRLVDYTRQSFFEGLKMVQPGNRIGDVAHAIQKYLEDAGYGVVRELTGHGIGRSLHESPEVPNYGAAGKGVKLRAGMVLAIEPMVNMGSYKIKLLPDGWTTVTFDGKLSAHYENTIAVTRDGYTILTLSDGDSL